jgi:hypothetical protein
MKKILFTVNMNRHKVVTRGTVVGFKPGTALVRTHSGNLFAVNTKRQGTPLPDKD